MTAKVQVVIFLFL